MSIAFVAGLGVVLAAVAFVASMLGIGGGVAYTPIQVFFGIEIHTAAATSLFLIIILSLGATSVYHRAGKVDWKVTVLLEIFTATGGFAGGYLSSFIHQNILITILTAAVVLAGAVMMREGKDPENVSTKHAWYKWRRDFGGLPYELNLLVAVPVCTLAGALSGMIGIGGGIIKVPMMVVLFGIPMDIAVATSGLMVGVTAIGGFAGHAVAGHFDWRMGLILTPGVFLGAWLGAHTMLRIDRRILKKIFGVAMFLIACGLMARMILK